MANCEFLNKETSHCVGCTGWFCTSLGRRKKLGDDSICRNEVLWVECPRYLRVYPKLVEERETVSTDDYVEPVSKPEEEPVVEVKPKTRKKTKPKKTVEEIIELPPTEEVISTQIVDETITVAVEPTQPIATTPPGDCPYLGPIPPGECGCCDVWCYSTSEPLRSFKHCKSPPSWRECRSRIEAERRGVKHASA